MFKFGKPVSFLIVSAILLSMMPRVIFAATAMADADNITDNSATILATIATASGENCTLASLNLYTNPNFTNPIIPNDKTWTPVSGQIHSESFYVLLPQTKYYIRVRFYSGNNILKEATGEFTTLASSANANVSLYDLTFLPSSGTYAAVNAKYTAASGIRVDRLGAVYSSADQNPFVNGANTYTVNDTYGSGGVIAAVMNNLTGTNYYVKAFMDYTENGVSKREYSAVYTYNHSDYGAPGAPRVTTTNAYKTTDTMIYAYGAISSTGSSSPNDWGFVYSNSNPAPDIYNSSKIPGSSVSSNGNFDASITIPNYQTGTYYVRAYAVNSYGTSYGDVKQVSLSAQSTRVILQSEDFIGPDSAQFTIYVPSQTQGSLLERGIVLSKAPNTRPSIDGVNMITVNADKDTGSVKSGEISVTADKLERDTEYYVRAYVKTTSGTFYHAEDGLKIRTQKEGAILTLPVTDITETSAVTGGRMTLTDYTVRERGVFYSKVNTAPDITNSEKAAHEKSEAGEFNITLSNLTPNTTYYVRAYFYTINGYDYGITRTFKTEDTSYVKISDITASVNGAIVKANILNAINYNVTERGVVYSATQAIPIITNGDYRLASTSGTGDFEVALTSLTPKTKYYIRAYAKTSQGYYYSNPVREFTAVQDASVKIGYRLSDGTQIGTQDISCPVGTEILAGDLKIPTGYRLESAGFRHVAAGNDSDSFIIVVAPESKTEAPFAEGMGGYRFEPLAPMTRVGVVKMIYNLMGEGKTYESALKFSDMPTDFNEINAINFCTSRGIIVGDAGKFKPYDSVTRAQFAVIISKAYNLVPNNSVNVGLTDITGHWGRTYITIAVQNGIISGYAEDKTFRPDRQVNRAEAVTMLVKASGRSLKPLGTAQFTDVLSGDWYYDVIMNAAVPAP